MSYTASATTARPYGVKLVGRTLGAAPLFLLRLPWRSGAATAPGPARQTGAEDCPL